MPRRQDVAVTVTTHPTETRSRRLPLLLLQGVYAVFLPVWFALSIAATMGLANTDAWWAAPGMLLVWAYPLVAVVAVVVSHVLWTRNPRRAHLVNALPRPWVLIGAALLLWVLASELG